MEDDYNDSQDSMNDNNRIQSDGNDSGGNGNDGQKDFQDNSGYDDHYEDEDNGNNFRNGRGGRGNFIRGRGRGPPPGWMNGPPPMRFRGRGYGPGGPPMRGRGFFRGRGGPRFGPNGGPNFDGGWGPMGPPPPGMMGGPPPFGPPPGMMGPGGPMGPPPNMMGQPPPFGAPPGMPPPNMPAPELWVETKSEDGKSYYYHARSRETTWSRPQDTPTCKVITQAEMEAMAATGQLPPMNGSQTGGPPQGMGGPPQGMGGPPQGMGAPPQGMGGPPQGMGGPPQGMVGPPQGMGGPPHGMNSHPGMGGPPQGMGGPPQGMGGPPQGMGGPPQGMGGPPQGMGGPPQGMGGPPQGMGGPPQGMGGPPQGMNMGMPGPMGGPPMNMMPPGVNTPTTNAGSPFGPGPGWMKMDNGGMSDMSQMQQDSRSPSDNDDSSPPGDGRPMNQPPALIPGLGSSGPPLGGDRPPFAGAPPSRAAQPDGPGAAGGGPGFSWGGWGQAWPPPLLAQPPPSLATATLPAAGQAQTGIMNVPQLGAPAAAANLAAEPTPAAEPPAQQPKKEETRIPAELAAAAGEWTAHRAPDGRPYYYNAQRQQSIWEKPKPMKELEELQAKIAVERRLAAVMERRGDAIDLDDSNEVVDVDAYEEAQAAAAAAAAAEREAAARRQAEAERAAAEAQQRQQREQAEAERLQREKDEKEKAKLSRSRPTLNVHISGTPWCVVWTGDGRMFFFNSAASTSVWKRPAELEGRADVDKAISQPPAALQDLQRKEAAEAAPAKAANGELKRSADSSSDDSDSEPIKKPKVDEAPKKTVAPVEPDKDASAEAEKRAARERAIRPLESRVAEFRAMLSDKDVSAFSTWEKELHKIIYDRRYLLLTSKERKQVFEKYVRERAEGERKEKKNRLMQKKNEFRLLMEEAKLHSKSTFSEFSARHGKDDRFKGVEKARDRDVYFNEFICELRKREKDDKERKREQVKNDFIAMLREKGVERRSRWPDAKKRVEGDARYKAVDGSGLREDYYREYCKLVKEERKKEKDAKEKDKDRSSSKKDKKDKERDKDKDKDKDKDTKDKKEKREKKEKSDQEGGEPAASAVEQDATMTEEKEADAEEGDAGSDGEAAAREREARAQASIKEREREVQRALATSLRDRDKEREQHKRDEAVQHFNALLCDLVRNPDLSWREAKKQLKKDHRFALAELLVKEDKERLFTTYTGTLAGRRRDKLRALLDELKVSATDAWRSVRKQLRADARTPVYSSSDKMEREFRDYQRDKTNLAKNALRQLLLETRSITHKSLTAVREEVDAMSTVTDALKHDARYTALEHLPGEREQLVMAYLEELHKKGPPPPPTATEPNRRAKQ